MTLLNTLRNLLMPAPNQFQERGGAPAGALTQWDVPGTEVRVPGSSGQVSPETVFVLRDLMREAPQWEPGVIPDPSVAQGQELASREFNQRVDARMQESQQQAASAMLLKSLLDKNAMEEEARREDAMNLDQQLQGLEAAFAPGRAAELQSSRNTRGGLVDPQTAEEERYRELLGQRSRRQLGEYFTGFGQKLGRGLMTVAQLPSQTISEHQPVPAGSPEYQAWQERVEAEAPTLPHGDVAEHRPHLDPQDPRNPMLGYSNIMDPTGSPDFPQLIAFAERMKPETAPEHAGALYAEIVTWMAPILPAKFRTAASMEKWLPRLGRAIETHGYKPPLTGPLPYPALSRPTATGAATTIANMGPDALDAILKSTFLEYSPEETQWATAANVGLGMGIRGWWRNTRYRQARRNEQLDEVFEESRRLTDQHSANEYIAMERSKLQEQIRLGQKPQGSTLPDDVLEQARLYRYGDPNVRPGIRSKGRVVAEMGLRSNEMADIYIQSLWNLRQVNTSIDDLLKYADETVGPLRDVRGADEILTHLETLSAKFNKFGDPALAEASTMQDLLLKHPAAMEELGQSRNALTKLIATIKERGLLPSSLRDVNTLFNKFRTFTHTMDDMPQIDKEFFNDASISIRDALNNMDVPMPVREFAYFRGGHRTTEAAPQYPYGPGPRPVDRYTPETIRPGEQAKPYPRAEWEGPAAPRVHGDQPTVAEQFDYLMADASNYLHLMDDIEKKMMQQGYEGGLQRNLLKFFEDPGQMATTLAALATNRQFLALRATMIGTLQKGGVQKQTAAMRKAVRQTDRLRRTKKRQERRDILNMIPGMRYVGAGQHRSLFGPFLNVGYEEQLSDREITIPGTDRTFTTPQVNIPFSPQRDIYTQMRPGPTLARQEALEAEQAAEAAAEARREAAQVQLQNFQTFIAEQATEGVSRPDAVALWKTMQLAQQN